MECKELTLIYFSPTNTTETIVKEIAAGIGENSFSTKEMPIAQGRPNEK